MQSNSQLTAANWPATGTATNSAHPPRSVARALVRSLKLNGEVLADDRTNRDLENADRDLGAGNVLTGVLKQVAP